MKMKTAVASPPLPLELFPYGVTSPWPPPGPEWAQMGPNEPYQLSRTFLLG